MVFIREALRVLVHPWLLLALGAVLLLLYMPKGWIPLSGGERRSQQIEQLIAGLSQSGVAQLVGNVEGTTNGCGWRADGDTLDAVLSHVALDRNDVVVGGRFHASWVAGQASGMLASSEAGCAAAWADYGDDGRRLPGTMVR